MKQEEEWCPGGKQPAFDTVQILTRIHTIQLTLKSEEMFYIQWKKNELVKVYKVQQKKKSWFQISTVGQNAKSHSEMVLDVILLG